MGFLIIVDDDPKAAKFLRVEPLREWVVGGVDSAAGCYTGGEPGVQDEWEDSGSCGGLGFADGFGSEIVQASIEGPRGS